MTAFLHAVINVGLWLGLILMVFAIWWAFLAPQTAPTKPTEALPERRVITSDARRTEAVNAIKALPIEEEP